MNIGFKSLYDETIFFVTDRGKLEPEIGQIVIFQPTGRPLLAGEVIFKNRKKLSSYEVKLEGELLRLATSADLKKITQQKILAAKACEEARECLRKVEPQVQIITARLTFDKAEINLFFFSPERIEFNKVVPPLSGLLKKRIHLYQLGPRDRARMLNGFGVCGRPQCCSANFLPKFQPISLQMAREQGLNAKGVGKISGNCGKLFCCLAYEKETYARLQKNLPAIGTTVKTPAGAGQVINLNLLKQSVKVQLAKNKIKSFSVEEIKLVKN